MNEKIVISINEFEEAKRYWCEKLSGSLSSLELPYDYSGLSENERGSSRLILNPQLWEKLNQVSKGKDIALYVVLAAAFKVMVYKLTGQQDVMIASPVYSDSGKEYKYNSYVVLRDHIHGEMTFRELLTEEKETVLNAYEYQHYAMDRVFESLGVDREELSPAKAVLLLENIHRKESVQDFMKSPENEIILSFLRLDDRLEGMVHYNSKRLKEDTVKTVKECFTYVLEQVVNDLNIQIDDIGLVREIEKNKLLSQFNPLPANNCPAKTICEMFEEQVIRRPDAIAVEMEGAYLTYSELNRKSNRLAGLLRKKGIKPNEIVGLLVERSLEMVVGVMGILKAGAAYLPISPEYPEERVRFMLEDSKAALLLTQENLRHQVNFDGEVILLQDEIFYEDDSGNLQKINKSSDLAYVIYTSGTTGKPKGVLVEHGSLSETIRWRREEYGLNEADHVLQLFSFAFDGFVTSFFTPLISGSKVVLLSEDDAKNPMAIKRKIVEQKITHFICVPSLYDAILECISSEEAGNLRVVTLAGEKVSAGLVEKSKEKIIKLELVNEYGPTESTVVATIARDVKAEPVISIGRPVANTAIYITGKNFEILPVGIAGEICIGGSRVAKGYLNRDDLTSEKFIPNPYLPGTRVYKTGDFGRWLPDGRIEFIGRMDNQVKIRGFRVELYEIENQLLANEHVKEAVVLDKEGKDGGKYLCAYLVLERELTNLELEQYLSERLPDYMIPSFFIKLDKMPVTPNGKIDRKSLLARENIPNTPVEYAGPRNQVEERLVEIWQEVLEVTPIGINDSFMKMGGHSLKATMMALKIHAALNVEVPLKEIFARPTIRELSEYIAGLTENGFSNIRPVEVREYYPVSSAQKRLYLLNLMEGPSTTYNMPSVILIEGTLDRERLEEAFQTLVGRHEALRTSFEMVEGIPVQRVHKSIKIKITHLEAAEDDVEHTIKGLIHPFALNKAPLLRVGLVRLSKSKHILVYDMHHIISDGVSMTIILKELTAIYNHRELPELRIQYKDFSVWQNELIQSEGVKKQEAYWLEKFKGEIPVLNMATDYPRPSFQSFEGNSISFDVGEDITAGLEAIAAKTGATKYMVLLAVFNILLSKYSGQEDIVVGSPIAGRQHADLGNIVGMFVNTLAMRNQPGRNKAFPEFLQEVKENALKAYENQDYQFEELVEKLGVKRDLSRNPLFDVMFMLQNMSAGEASSEGLVFKPYATESTVSKFDLTLTAFEAGKNILFSLEYCVKLFKKATIERISKHFVQILKTVAENPDLKLSEIEMLTAAEKHRILREFNLTNVVCSTEKTFQQLFEEQVEETPDNIAVVYEDKTLTYSELNKRANQLARELRNQGVKPDSIVAIMVERSIEMVVGILGILKAGGAYLPIDAEYPQARINYMLEDSGTCVLLTQHRFNNKLPFQGSVIELDEDGLYAGDTTNLTHINTSSDLAYVIYTSGSTGSPKGVMVGHKGLSSLKGFFGKWLGVGERDRILQFASIAFDASVWEITMSITSGSALYIITKEDIQDYLRFENFIHKNHITIATLPPSYAVNINHENVKGLRKLVTAGSSASKALVEKWRGRLEYINAYGPTETTICATAWKCDAGYDKDAPVPIGRPIHSMRVYILNKDKRLQPIGVPGELCIAGDGLARGYLNRPELTAEKFETDPWVHGERMYYTGDLARWLPDGNIEYLGRMDHQVKIRGYRIELGEVETQLLKHPLIHEAVVVARDDGNGDKSLCAYIVPGGHLAAHSIREYLSQDLPEYMIPTYFIPMERLPLTTSGKVDRKALPAPDNSFHIDTAYEAPVNELENMLVRIWKEVLGVDKIGVHDNFFELGGHSLRAATLVSRIHKEMGVEIPLREVFSIPTVKGLAAYVRKAGESIFTAIEPVEKKDYYPLSAAQRRLFIVNRMEAESTAYNMPGAYIIEGKIDRKRFEEAFGKLIQRHETLRTSFDINSGEPVQRVHEDVGFHIEYLEAEEEEMEGLVKERIKPFDLAQAPLLRVTLIRVADDRHILLYDMHHIISDGVSMSILTREFAVLYQGESLSPLRLQYRDYTLWQESLIVKGVLKQQEEYWLDAFKGEIPVLEMPTDYERPEVKSFEGSNVQFLVGQELTAKLKSLAAETGTTLYMVLLAAYNLILSKYTGQEEIVVGTPVAGRPHADLENIIGIFINTLAMRNYPRAEMTFREFLLKVKENSLKAYENQSYPFDRLVEKLNIQRDISRNPVFDVMFNLQNMEGTTIDAGSLKFIPYTPDKGTIKLDLNLLAMEEGNRLAFRLEYCVRLFKKETIERMTEHFKNILMDIAESPDKKISKVKMLFGNESLGGSAKICPSKDIFDDEFDNEEFL